MMSNNETSFIILGTLFYFRDIAKIQLGLGAKLGKSIDEVTLFIVALVTCLSVGWELTLSMLATAPLLIVSIAIIFVVCIAKSIIGQHK